MTELVVDTVARTIAGPFGTRPCRIGRGGACAPAAKREGDGCTPLGRFPVRGALFRTDRFAPPAGLRLPWRRIVPTDGWSDDPADPAYNRPVRHPHPFSAERLWRADAAYDAVLVIGHNDRPPVPLLGSAIFLHLHASDVTEGCIAVARPVMAEILAVMTGGDLLQIEEDDAGEKPLTVNS